MMQGTFGVFENEGLVAGDEQSRRRAREDLRRRRRLHFAESSNWPRLDLADLRFERFHVEHTPTRTRYRIVRGEVMDAQFTPANAWYISPQGPVFLEALR